MNDTTAPALAADGNPKAGASGGGSVAKAAGTGSSAVMGRQPVGRELFPRSNWNLTLNELLSHCDRAGKPVPGRGANGYAREFKMRVEACRQAGRLERTPVVGVCGTMNSGKSTVVAGFLSDAGSRRVLVGELAREGTHRFVFWLPQSWRGNGLGSVLSERISSQTGHVPELLSSVPAEAFRQYNAARDRLAEFDVPLIAYDPALDERGIAFLDCPDIQRSLNEAVSAGTAHLRLEGLRRVATLCSAFVVVASMKEAGGEDLGKVFHALDEAAGKAPRFFLLNMTETDEVGVYRDEALKVLGRWGQREAVRRLYLSAHVTRETPASPLRPKIVSMDGDGKPLESLASELDTGELQRLHSQSCLDQLGKLLDEARQLMETVYAEESGRAREARNVVVEFIRGNFIGSKADGGELKALEVTPAARQLGESIKRKAPWAMRMAQAPVEAARGVFVKLRTRDATEEDLKNYARVDGTKFAGHMRGRRFIPAEVDDATLIAIWDDVVKDVRRAAAALPLDNEESDRLAELIWKEVPFARKLVLYRNILISMATLTLAGMLMPVDGGASLMVSAKFGMVLGGGEVLAILLGGPLLGALISNSSVNQQIREHFEENVTKPQLRMLYVALAARLGFPAWLEGWPKKLTVGKRLVHDFSDDHNSLTPAGSARGGSIAVVRSALVRIDEDAWAGMLDRLAGEGAE